MSEGTERIHSSGGLTLSERLGRIENSMERHEIETERWQREHQEKDDRFQAKVEGDMNQRKGNLQIGNLLVIVLAAIASICSIVGMFWKPH